MAERNPRPLLGVGVNHVQAIRDALSWSIAGEALLDLSKEAVVNWLVEQGLENSGPGTESDSPVSIVLASVQEYRQQALQELGPGVDAISSSLMNPDAKTVGQDRSGTGWSEGAAFCISSAFVRVLGASEQFELDVLKALLYYRPSGQPLGHPDDQIEITVEMDIVTEEPVVKGGVHYYEKPAIWTWLRRSAEGNDERRKIFKRVYSLELTPGETSGEREDNNKLRKEWYTKRNIVAHGRAGVEIRFKEYLDVDAYVTKSMVHLATQCQEKQKLIV